MTISVYPITSSFVAEIGNVDLSQPLQRFASGCDLIATMLKPVQNVVPGKGGKSVTEGIQ